MKSKPEGLTFSLTRVAFSLAKGWPPRGTGDTANEAAVYHSPRRARRVLVLSRKLNQSIMIGADIRVVVIGVDRDQVKLGIEAPRSVPVHRFEIYEEIHRGDSAAAAPREARGR